MKKGFVSILVIAVLCALISCAKKEEQKGPYLAKVGSAKITLSDLERDIKNLPEFAQKLFEGPGGQEKFLDEMIKKELLYQEATKKGIDKDPEYLQKLEEFKKLPLTATVALTACPFHRNNASGEKPSASISRSRFSASI